MALVVTMRWSTLRWYDGQAVRFGAPLEGLKQVNELAVLP